MDLIAKIGASPALAAIGGLNDAIQKIGAYAGILAFAGLSVLATLLFIQARDLRRLREWAGRAPERDAELIEVTSEVAAERSEEIRKVEEARAAEEAAAADREERRKRRDLGLEDDEPVPGIPDPATGFFTGIANRLRGTDFRDPRRIAAIAGVVLLLGGLIAFGAITIFSGGGGGGGGSSNSSKQSASSGPASPAQIEVAVLNGTAVPGLAANVGDDVEKSGFSLGAVTNSPSSFTTTIVMFTRGHKPEAEMVAKALKVKKVQLMTPDISGPAAGANVAVVVGEDQQN